MIKIEDLNMIDMNWIMMSFRNFMMELGLDTTNPDIKDTPKRVARMYVDELFEGLYKPEPILTVFENKDKYNQIITNSATIYSTCEHHFVPIEIKLHIGYIPKKKICGISKLIRVAEWFAHRPQTQERLVQQIADYIMKKLKPRGVMVVAEGIHFCEVMRGVKKTDAIMKNSEIRGCFKHKDTRDEFMELIRK